MTDLPSTSLQQQDKEEDCSDITDVLEENHCLSSILYSEENIQK